MEVSPQGASEKRHIAIFPRQSTTLICSSSNSGKTFFISRVLQHCNFFFEPEQVKRIVYINAQGTQWSANLGLEQDIQELAYEDIETHELWLQQGDLVILDDVITPTPGLIKLLKYSAHHQDATVFVVTQSLIGDRLYALTYLAHFVVLLLNTSAASRIGVELLQRFFLAADTKKYLKIILSEAEKHKSTVVLKLNSIASAHSVLSQILCFSQVEKLFTLSYCLVHPELGFMDQFEEGGLNLEGVDDSQLILVPARYVIKKQERLPDEKCINKESWDDFVTSLNSDIEITFPYKKWSSVKALTREILKNNQLCISNDYRQIILKSNPNYKVNILDFLQVATRKPGPHESFDKFIVYKPLMSTLLAANIPSSFILNKHLLDVASQSRKRQNGRLQKSYPEQKRFSHRKPFGRHL